MSDSLEVAVEIGDMSCASCASSIEKAVDALEGVETVDVNFATGKATVNYIPDETGLEEIEKAVEDAGYTPENIHGGEIVEKTRLKITGMSCASCAESVEESLRELEGVNEASVNFASEKAEVKYRPEKTGKSDFREAVEAAGYGIEDEEDATEKELEASKKRMLIGWGLSIPIIAWMIPEMLLGIVWPSKTVYDLGMTLLALPVLFYAGRHTYSSAVKSLMNGSANMDVLILLGSLSAFITGPATLFTPLLNYAGVGA
ncbi:MAG: copper ion binding protein, partial [Candidatus Nanohalobium sp.]